MCKWKYPSFFLKTETISTLSQRFLTFVRQWCFSFYLVLKENSQLHLSTLERIWPLMKVLFFQFKYGFFSGAAWSSFKFLCLFTCFLADASQYWQRWRSPRPWSIELMESIISDSTTCETMIYNFNVPDQEKDPRLAKRLNCWKMSTEEPIFLET